MGRMLFLVYKIMGRMRGIYIMDITREKTMRIVNYIFAVLIILCIAVMLLPANYSVEYSLYGKDMDKHTLTEVEYSSDSDLERHKADKNNTTVKVPYVAGETFDEMNIYTDTKNIKMAIMVLCQDLVQVKMRNFYPF